MNKMIKKISALLASAFLLLNIAAVSSSAEKNYSV